MPANISPARRNVIWMCNLRHVCWSWHTMWSPCLASEFHYSPCDVTAGKYSFVYTGRCMFADRDIHCIWFPCLALEFQYSPCNVMVCKDSFVMQVVECFIMKTCLYNFDPLKPHFDMVKLGFTGVYIIFLISAHKHRLWVLVRTASSRLF